MSVIQNDNENSNKIYKLKEIINHNTVEDLWMVLFNKIYDISKFIEVHPGGGEVLLDCGGVDATKAFEDVCHSEDALRMLEPFYIGDLNKAEITKHYINRNEKNGKKGDTNGIDTRNWDFAKRFTFKVDDNVWVLCVIALTAYALFLFIQWKKLTDWVVY